MPHATKVTLQQKDKSAEIKKIVYKLGMSVGRPLRDHSPKEEKEERALP